MPFFLIDRGSKSAIMSHHLSTVAFKGQTKHWLWKGHFVGILCFEWPSEVRCVHLAEICNLFENLLFCSIMITSLWFCLAFTLTRSKGLTGKIKWNEEKKKKSQTLFPRVQLLIFSNYSLYHTLTRILCVVWCGRNVKDSKPGLMYTKPVCMVW